MNPEDVALTDFSEDDLAHLTRRISDERQARMIRRAVEAMANPQALDYLSDSQSGYSLAYLTWEYYRMKPEQPPAWEEPPHIGLSYPQGFIVKHDGNRWKSLIPVNYAEPGVGQQWERVADDAAIQGSPV